jgi:hypothetical protein
VNIYLDFKALLFYLKGGEVNMKLQSIKVDPSQLKKRDLMKAKFSAKSAINALTEILADL